MSAHTPGPIRYDFEPGYCGELVASNGTTIATFTDEPSAADARRLAACWNACEGISTESLESAGNAFNGWRLASYALDDAKAQRNELLAACKAMIACCYDLDRNDETLAAVKTTMAAIAKATGELP